MLRFYAEKYIGQFVFFPAVVLVWGPGFCGGTTFKLDINWAMFAAGVEWTRG